LWMFIALSFDNTYVEKNARQAFLQKFCQNGREAGSVLTFERLRSAAPPAGGEKPGARQRIIGWGARRRSWQKRSRGSNPTLPRQHFSLREGEHLDRAFDAHLAGEHSGRSVARRRARQLPPAADIPPYEAMSEKCQDRSLPQCSTLAGEQYCRHIEAKPTLR